MGFGANGGFDYTKELKEEKNKGFGAKGGFGCTKEKRELIVKIRKTSSFKQRCV